jgi:hypothetical protein
MAPDQAILVDFPAEIVRIGGRWWRPPELSA